MLGNVYIEHCIITIKEYTQTFTCSISSKNVLRSLNVGKYALRRNKHFPLRVCAQNVKTFLFCNLQQPKTLKLTH